MSLPVALDTTVLVRLLANADPVQAQLILLAWLGLNPVRQGQACDALELPLVVGHHSGTLCQGMAGDP